MKIDKKLLIAAVIVVIIVGSAIGYYYLYLAPTEEEEEFPENTPRYGGTMIIGMPSDMASLSFASVGQQFPLAQAYGDNMLGLNYKSTTSLEPRLVRSYSVSSDGLTITWNLIQNATYHCGHEFNSTTLKKTLEWCFEWHLPRIGGWGKYIDAIVAVDRFTLRVDLNTPIPGWNLWMVTAHAASLPAHCPYEIEANNGGYPNLGEYGTVGGVLPSGLGPFKVTEWVPGDHVTIEAFDDYWGGRPYIDKIIWKPITDPQTRLIALETGEIDAVMRGAIRFEDLPIVEAMDNVIIDESPSLQNSMLLQPYTIAIADDGSIEYEERWPMSDIRFREAFFQLIDWEAIIDVAFPYGGGVSCITRLEIDPAMATSAFKAEMKAIYPAYDEAAAKATIQELKNEHAFDGFSAGNELRIIGVNTQPEARKFAEYIASKLEDAGVNTLVEILESAVLDAKRAKGEYDIHIGHEGGHLHWIPGSYTRGEYGPGCTFTLPNGTTVGGSLLAPLVEDFEDDIADIQDMQMGTQLVERLREIEIKVAETLAFRRLATKSQWYAFWDYVKPGLPSNPCNMFWFTGAAIAKFCEVKGVPIRDDIWLEKPGEAYRETPQAAALATSVPTMHACAPITSTPVPKREE